MDFSGSGIEQRFEAYVEALVGVIGHADQASPLRDYCRGLLLPVARKSVEPLAAASAPSRVSAQHQSLLHFVGQAAWSDEAVLARVRALVLPRLERSGPLRAWIVDDTAIQERRRSPPVVRGSGSEYGVSQARSFTRLEDENAYMHNTKER